MVLTFFRFPFASEISASFTAIVWWGSVILAVDAAFLDEFDDSCKSFEGQGEEGQGDDDDRRSCESGIGSSYLDPALQKLSCHRHCNKVSRVSEMEIRDRET
jgi:hypothetical protein